MSSIHDFKNTSVSKSFTEAFSFSAAKTHELLGIAQTDGFPGTRQQTPTRDPSSCSDDGDGEQVGARAEAARRTGGAAGLDSSLPGRRTAAGPCGPRPGNAAAGAEAATSSKDSAASPAALNSALRTHGPGRRSTRAPDHLPFSKPPQPLGAGAQFSSG